MEAHFSLAGCYQFWSGYFDRRGFKGALIFVKGGLDLDQTALSPILGHACITRLDRNRPWSDLRRVQSASFQNLAPAAVRFLSCEPLLEELGELDLRGISWVIVGGGSGPDADARRCHLRWIDNVTRQCKEAHVRVFVEQLGAKPIDRNGSLLRLKDRKGGDMDEWTADLRIREFPNATLVSAADDGPAESGHAHPSVAIATEETRE